MQEQTSYRSTSVRAIIRRGDLILVEWLPSIGIAFLPGGTVEAEEDLTTTLTRELNEEIEGASFEIGTYRGCIGHRWRKHGEINSCLNHFFEVRLNGPADVVAREAGRQLKWISLNTEESRVLQPPSLARLLAANKSDVWDVVDESD